MQITKDGLWCGGGQGRTKWPLHPTKRSARTRERPAFLSNARLSKGVDDADETSALVGQEVRPAPWLHHKRRIQGALFIHARTSGDALCRVGSVREDERRWPDGRETAHEGVGRRASTVSLALCGPIPTCSGPALAQ